MSDLANYVRNAMEGRPVTTSTPMAAQHVLSLSECLRLLEPGGRGRVAATMRAVPVIIPVGFVLCGDDVVFRPATDARLARAINDNVVAFQTDHLGCDGRSPWAVHVTGVALAFDDGAPGTRFRLPPTIITGWGCGRTGQDA